MQIAKKRASVWAEVIDNQSDMSLKKRGRLEKKFLPKLQYLIFFPTQHHCVGVVVVVGGVGVGGLKWPGFWH